MSVKGMTPGSKHDAAVAAAAAAATMSRTWLMTWRVDWYSSVDVAALSSSFRNTHRNSVKMACGASCFFRTHQ